MTGGRIVGHASYFLPQPQNRLFLVGYQGEETLGRQLQEGEKNVLIEEQEIEVRASVSETRSMSSHADQKQLMDWLSDIQGVKKVFLTHGEDGPREVLSKKIQEEIGIQDITMPHLREEVTF
jgi:metallo-beta-lactamase family protein